MQLKMRRSQRQGGLINKSAIFCLDARVSFTPQEAGDLVRYKLEREVIYNSDSSKRYLANYAETDTATMGSALKGLAFAALAGMQLNVSIESLRSGQHIECKSLDELLGAEEAIMIACKNLKGYLDTAATFDGREVLIDFDTDDPEKVSITTATPPQALISSSPSPSPPATMHYTAPQQAFANAPAALALPADPAYTPQQAMKFIFGTTDGMLIMFILVIPAILISFASFAGINPYLTAISLVGLWVIVRVIQEGKG